MEIIFYLFLITTAWLLTKEYSPNTNNRTRMKKFFPVVLIAWSIPLTLYLFNGYGLLDLPDINDFLIDFIFLILFALCNTFLLIYIRAFINTNYWFLLLFFPSAWLFYLNVLIFNKPTYNGAMDGFAALADFYAMLMILITYPVFIFAFNMTKCYSKIKGVFMLLFVAGTGVSGVKQTIGREGYLADDTGKQFVVILLILAIIGISYMTRETAPTNTHADALNSTESD